MSEWERDIPSALLEDIDAGRSRPDPSPLEDEEVPESLMSRIWETCKTLDEVEESTHSLLTSGEADALPLPNEVDMDAEEAPEVRVSPATGTTQAAMTKWIDAELNDPEQAFDFANSSAAEKAIQQLFELGSEETLQKLWHAGSQAAGIHLVELRSDRLLPLSSLFSVSDYVIGDEGKQRLVRLTRQWRDFENSSRLHITWELSPQARLDANAAQTSQSLLRIALHTAQVGEVARLLQRLVIATAGPAHVLTRIEAQCGVEICTLIDETLRPKFGRQRSVNPGVISDYIRSHTKPMLAMANRYRRELDAFCIAKDQSSISPTVSKLRAVGLARKEVRQDAQRLRNWAMSALIDIGSLHSQDEHLVVSQNPEILRDLKEVVRTCATFGINLSERRAIYLTRLAKRFSDVSGLDLTSVNLNDVELEGLTWSDATTWPEDWEERVRNRSRMIGPHTYLIDSKMKGRHRESANQ
ncbi:hypothetical protein PUN71_021630 [Arthrobacter sp. NQ7]|uniref:hypothetical protein n=1 Tax=Arthrobacter sp. NQ7 TaxID=3032303 RepID=UPI00240EE279|nr:hypothetical protein [Arthrobacter sp. NQ7]MDJ0459813.1 hypothetical protein [Arthrobacter sp. NQ7]